MSRDPIRAGSLQLVTCFWSSTTGSSSPTSSHRSGVRRADDDRPGLPPAPEQGVELDDS
jgi:hypothetical protein